MKTLITFVAVFFFVMVAALSTQASERDDVIEAFERLSPSVGALYAQEAGGDIAFLCSATAVGRYKGDTIILTANHCLRRGVGYLINFGDNVMRSLMAWKVPHYEVDAAKHPKIYNEPDTDMAMFLMEGEEIPIVEMAASGAIPPGSKIVMLGFPLGVTKLRYEGTVSGYFDRVGTSMYNYMMVQIFASSGSSGSSVVDLATGKVVGVLIGAKQGYVGLPVIFVTPIEYQRYLLPVMPEDEDEEDEKEPSISS